MNEAKVFIETWTDKYFSVETNNKAVCLICREIVSVFKDYNLKDIIGKNMLGQI